MILGVFCVVFRYSSLESNVAFMNGLYTVIEFHDLFFDYDFIVIILLLLSSMVGWVVSKIISFCKIFLSRSLFVYYSYSSINVE